jgi:hypothetical protein
MTLGEAADALIESMSSSWRNEKHRAQWKMTMRRSWGKARSGSPDLFDWQRSQELLSAPTIRTIARKAHVSPALAAVIADLCGFSREAR